MPETSSQYGSPPIGFLCLPLEIRESIYIHLLLRSAVLVQYLDFEVDSWIKSIWEDPERLDYFADAEGIVPKRKTSILSVSRQISEEALNVLYGRNLFIVHIHDGAHRDLLKFGTANLRRIRHLRLVAQPNGVCFPKPIKFDSKLWIPLLTDLSQLCLVVQQPLQARTYYYNAPSLEEDVRKWVAWLEPIIRYLAQNIKETTTVGIDDNDLIETGEVVQKYFCSGYEKVRTVTGDRIFKRGEFSWESGHWDDDDDDGSTNFEDGGMGDDGSDRDET
ncbi:hypothetical protein EG329_003153 [Mollisiaceae sp. DMI_Dod_QoI]|nr:hypothetical protein EG329_003153 [Helotiales sp. DMI_Dod_QoI]